MRNLTPNAVPCPHCGTLTFRAGGFCCGGCEAVSRALDKRGLDDFYRLKARAPSVRASGPVTVDGADFDPTIWEAADFRKRYVTAARLRVHLEGVHCLGCLWLIESLPERLRGVHRARLDLSRSVAAFDIDENAMPGDLARELVALGYRPCPLAPEDEGAALARNESRRETIRLAVAALCAGNTMIAAVAVYAGASGSLQSLFSWVSAVLFLPVIGYAAVPFYRQAWAKLRRGGLSVDLPIASAIAIGGALSFANLFRGNGDVYFDSLATIVFLLLAVRLALRRLQGEALSWGALTVRGDRRAMRRAADGALESIPASSVLPGDRLLIEAGGVFPADGILRSPSTEVDLSLLTGEPFPVRCLAGEPLFAGTRNRGPRIEVEVTAVGADCRVQKILSQAEDIAVSKTEAGRLADRVGSLFVAAVLTVAAGLLLFGAGGSFTEAARRALSLSVVSCPCAFAFAVPLTFLFALRRLAGRGIVVRDPGALERVARARRVFLDKTGTLTEGRPTLVEWRRFIEDDSIDTAVVALERRSFHPYARAIVRELGDRADLPVDSFREIPGVGVLGTVAGRRYSIEALREEAEPTTELSRIRIRRDDEIVAEGALVDPLRPGSAAAVDALVRRGLEPWLLSGDDLGPVRRAAAATGIAATRAFGRLTPEGKEAILRRHERSIMVGDGANDAIALARAEVGIAVHGSLEAGLRSASVYLTEPGIGSLVALVDDSRRAIAVLHVCLAASLLYNTAGIALAATGHLSPFLAALLMPSSSLTVLAVTVLGMRRSA